ncbi:MAG: hypothetical protein QJR00_08510, partial [Bacillota bacterium]|nr:hypothetical protein [Bacillota bacterium]
MIFLRQRWPSYALGLLFLLAGLFLGWETRAWLQARAPLEGTVPPPPPEDHAPPLPPNAGDEPDLFSKSVYFDGLFQPTALAFASDGSLYVAQADGTVWLLDPPGQDGKPRSVRLLASGIPNPQGLWVLKKDDL